ncbi:MAG: hypothetical protein ABWY18_02625 [Tardiphaga sp.]
MPKYHFEIVDGFRLEDPVGIECPSEDEAKTVAHDIARQIAIDVASQNERNVVVVDDEGAEVYQTPIEHPDN